MLLEGESGTGKELFAQALHQHSPRRNRPFVKVACAALPETLLESELFGHEKGSFTGATEKQIGKFEQADRGSIFLDEVGDMSQKTQAKVLRVLQEGVITPIGSARSVKVDVRVIAATNKNLEDEIAALNMAVGASFAGARAMTATSGPGASLMMEAFSLAGMAETPVVIAHVQRRVATT